MDERCRRAEGAPKRTYPLVSRVRHRCKDAGGGLAACVALVVVVGARPLYSSNQNTYLVRAVAAHEGAPLDADRLVRSADPARFFTWMIRAELAVGLGELGLYFLWALAATVFFLALWWATASSRRDALPTLLWAAGVGFAIAPKVRTLATSARSRISSDLPVPSDLFDGVAGQYALGPVLQPSVGAVALVAGVAVAVRHRAIRTAALLLWAGALIHPTYLLSAWLLLPGLLVAVLGPTWRASANTAIQTIALATGASFVVVAANLPTFAAVTSDDAVQGNRLLADLRIPHHSDPRAWFDIGTAIVLTIALIAALLARRSSEPVARRLGSFLTVSTVIIVATTAIAAAVDLPSLGLASPWRTSVIVVPLASSSLIAQFAGVLTDKVTGRTASLALAAVGAGTLLAAMTSGVRTTQAYFVERPSRNAVVVALKMARPEGEGLVPRNLELVRLNARVPIYVDWKNNPNDPSEVVRWSQRLAEADDAMAEPEALCDLVDRERFGWVVFPMRIDQPDGPACLDGWARTEIGHLVLAVRPEA